MKETLIIIGAGGHGKVVADIAIKTNQYKRICFLDDNVKNAILGLEIVGTTNDLINWLDSAEFFVAIGDSRKRENYINKIESLGATIATLIHPEAIVSDFTEIGQGTVIMAGVVVNVDTKIGEGVILNTACSIDHDNIISDYCHISVGTHLAGNVKVGQHTMIGAGATIINNITIDSECMIGAGAVVVKDINASGIYVGVPTRKIK